MTRMVWTALAGSLALGLSGCVAEDTGPAAQTASDAAPASTVAANPDREAWFGELHIHTFQSFDAFTMGVRTSVDDAYRFARGEPVEFMGRLVQRERPLDFMAVTDHAEQMGMGEAMLDPDNPLSQQEVSKKIVSGDFKPQDLLSIRDVDNSAYLDGQSVWERTIDAANRFNDPGRFTAFIGYEWSTMPDFQNLHRNVIFRGSDAPYPFSAHDSEKPEDMWAYLEANRARGYPSLAIPHNSNLSNGLMYDWVQSDGRPIDEAYAQRRALNEPLSEIAQNKGISETLPELSPEDPYADFEIMRNLMLKNVPGKIFGSYVREALARGLKIEQSVGANPYKFGFIGSSDGHSGFSTASEGAWGGHVWTLADVTTREAAKQAIRDDDPSFATVRGSAGALAGVWAESNTRESLFDAMRRRETFATSGTRIKIRLFAGWDFTGNPVGKPGWIAKAYSTGVPMGADLAPAAGKAAPRFLVWAAKDPEGVGLERAQIVKVWLEDGERREKVYDVAVSGAADGAALLTANWQDTGFDADNAAVYYLRVLEVKSPRWSTLLARKFDLPLPKSVPSHINERAWSSPIWYTPAK